MVDGAAVSRIGRSLAVVLVVGAVLVAGVGPAVGSGATPEDAAAGAERATLGADEVEADRTVLTVRVQEDGSAAWTIEYFVALETPEDEQAWEDLQNDIRTNTSDYLNRFSERINSTVDTAENDTEREMSATDYGVETRTQPQFGIVEYSFTWRGFAVAEGDEIRAGDAIDGFLLSEDTQLVIQWPESYTATSVEPAADTDRDNAAVWRGSETDFVTGEPRVVVSAAPDATTQPPAGGTTQPPAGGTTQPGVGTTTAADGTAPSAGTAPDNATDDEGGSDLPTAFLGGLLALAVVVGLSLYGYRQQEDASAGSGGESPEDGGGDGSTPGDAGEATASDAEAAAAGAAAAESDDAVPDEELLSNEERVLKLVRENGGRMKQQEVVDELDWTEAKTSQVVRGLRDDDELEGFRLGRENVLKLPEEDDEI